MINLDDPSYSRRYRERTGRMLRMLQSSNAPAWLIGAECLLLAEAVYGSKWQIIRRLLKNAATARYDRLRDQLLFFWHVTVCRMPEVEYWEKQNLRYGVTSEDETEGN